ncbi:hypothetical protein GVY41_07980 [Frigidibacter albus]|uniref:Uncharacterized protein n=1 Tax=Frigidibacter albus TaxID=1465486 RepID=A0A6L8VF79_9RHOB|nr:hypothetical protein [Frigidibacter albus]MZQ89007.1 hypothetical protein [Frigidibacter albus]NBE30936.1 hypothetical protein [Frigidibacter albus]
MDKLDFQVNAELISSGRLEVEEIILLTGGLCAFSCSDTTAFIYPILKDGQLTRSSPIPHKKFKQYIKSRMIDVIGVKQVTRGPASMHWRWAPAVECLNPPDNNPSYRWRMVSSSISRAIKRREVYSVIGRSASDPLSFNDMEKLAIQANHVSLSLHQLNFAIVNMAEYFQNELLAHLSTTDPAPARYSHIRGFDLSAFVHSFYQAFSAARDHYALFLAIQLLRQKVGGITIDSMPKLLNEVDPDDLRCLPIIRLLERNSLLRTGEGTGKSKGKDRLRFSSDTWLWYSNELRNRFTHRAPYGTAEGEGVTEAYQAEGDPELFLVKSFLERDGEKAQPNLLRTVNFGYQNICGLFLSAANLTGMMTAPPTISV